MKNFAESYHQEMKYLSVFLCKTSFIIGTLLFFFHWIGKNEGLIILGLYFTIIALITNSLLFIINLFCALFSKSYWNEYLKNSGILLINAPIALLYFYLVVEIIM